MVDAHYVDERREHEYFIIAQAKVVALSSILQ